MAVDITALYCCLDDFCKVFADWEAHRLLPSEQTRQRSGKLSRAEMLFIMVLFHLGTIRNFVRGGAVEPIRPWLRRSARRTGRGTVAWPGRTGGGGRTPPFWRDSR